MRPHSFITVTLVALLCASSARAEDVGREDQFKAAYVFNFLKFVEWPATVPSDALTVCVIGSGGVYETLAANVETKRAGARRLIVRRLAPSETAQGCNALYVEANSEAATVHAISSATSMLTVSDASGFTHRGGMIELFTIRNRLRFAINAGNAQKAGLRISSNLLQLAATSEGSAQ